MSRPAEHAYDVVVAGAGRPHHRRGRPSYEYWQRYFGREDFSYGTFGENLTVADALLYLPGRDTAKLHLAVQVSALSPGWQGSAAGHHLGSAPQLARRPAPTCLDKRNNGDRPPPVTRVPSITLGGPRWQWRGIM